MVVHSYPQVAHTCGNRPESFDVANEGGRGGVEDGVTGRVGLDTPLRGYSTSMEGPLLGCSTSMEGPLLGCSTGREGPLLGCSASMRPRLLDQREREQPAAGGQRLVLMRVVSSVTWL
ncbi:hypothetical protein [Rathayibacter festucae]|uniref:hypothetical protein n=1 Tax=Rathayibacter festucae TaxID=110937 RepID=UPI002A69E390|nr:hypothetical protein [Rathayibacter festucae]MDY0914681.1 hypothetical protein [Rathayibacter festucae]